MAVTSLWRVKGRVGGVVMYITNPNKTTEVIKHDTDNSENVLSGVIGYVERDSATNLREYVYGIGGVSPRTAAEDMMAVKRHYHKTGGVVAYHGYQSFAEGEVTPEEAHEIGKQLAQELWGDRYQVLVATHLDHESHTHNHFVINTVSYVDGIKYHRTKQDYAEMQNVSDRLCREHGLSVIRSPQRKGKQYAEWKAERNGEPTVRGTLKEAIDIAIRCSANIEDFKETLDRMGFVINQNGKYPKIKQKGSPRFVRFRSLGPGYDIHEIADRIDGNYHPVYPHIPRQESPQQIFAGEEDKGLDRDYRCFVKAIVLTMTRPEQNRYMYFLMRENHRQFKSYSVQSRILSENHIKTQDELASFRTGRQDKLDELLATRAELKNALKRAVRSGNGELCHHLRLNIDLATRQIKDCRDEIGACDSIAERSETVKKKLEIIRQEKFKGKEEQNNEHISRSGRPDRKNDIDRD